MTWIGAYVGRKLVSDWSPWDRLPRCVAYFRRGRSTDLSDFDAVWYNSTIYSGTKVRARLLDRCGIIPLTH